MDEHKPLEKRLSRFGRPPIYPWSHWMSGDVYEVEAGKDFVCSPKSLQNRLYHTARDKGMRVKTERIVEESKPVQIRFRFH